MQSKPWKKVSSQYVLRNPWYKVRQDQIIRPTGEEGTFNVVECGSSVFIIAITEEGKVILVKLFRYPTQHEGWEVPSGGVEKDEELLAAAQRELQEETGLLAAQWREVGEFDAMNGMTDSIAHVFIASGLRPADGHEQEEEGITEMQAYSPAELLEMIKTQKILDGVSIAAIMRAFAASGLKAVKISPTSPLGEPQ